MTPNNALYLQRTDGHLALCNTECLRLSGITKDTPNPFGGIIDKDPATGELTGILRDNAMNLVYPHIPVDPQEQDLAVEAAMKHVLQYGVTAVQDMGTFDEFRVYNRTASRNKLRIRMYSAVELSAWQQMATYITNNNGSKGDDMFAYGVLKSYVDGSLGSHTAYQKQNYSDRASRGLLVNTPEDLYTWTKAADLAGLQICVHAIGKQYFSLLIFSSGDEANTIILNIYERVLQENGVRDRRFRVEHAQQLVESDRARFARLNVTASVQPAHLLDDIPWAETALGPERINDLYVFQSLVNASTPSARVVFGSDWFVASANPLVGMFAAVTRITSNYPNGFNNAQRIAVEQALRAYTTNAAYASFRENKLGKLKAGYLADFAVLNKNLFTVDVKELNQVQVLMTIVNGNVEYQK